MKKTTSEADSARPAGLQPEEELRLPRCWTLLCASSSEDIVRFADMLAAIGTESRLRITQLLLTAHPVGMVAGDIQAELGISASNLSHHLEKLKHEGVICVKREGSFLRYTANTDAIQRVADISVRGVLHPNEGDQARQNHSTLR